MEEFLGSSNAILWSHLDGISCGVFLWKAGKLDLSSSVQNGHGQKGFTRPLTKLHEFFTAVFLDKARPETLVWSF